MSAPARWVIDPTGWCLQAQRRLSPHADARPEGTAIELVVLHNISLPPGQFDGHAVEEFFAGTLDPAAHPYFAEIAHLRVSAHFFVRRSGALIQCVSCADRAWHAGVSSWRGRERCNDFSIGIEIEGTDTLAYDDAQYRVVRRLLKALRQRYPIRAVTGHQHIAPGRKTDPGPAFDWTRVR